MSKEKGDTIYQNENWDTNNPAENAGTGKHVPVQTRTAPKAERPSG